MRYSENYSKLDLKIYTTIRRYYHKGKVGDRIIEEYPKGKHISLIMRIDRFTLDDINLRILQKDTDRRTRAEAYVLIQSFYTKIIDFHKERFYLYTLKRLGKTNQNQNRGVKS